MAVPDRVDRATKIADGIPVERFSQLGSARQAPGLTYQPANFQDETLDGVLHCLRRVYRAPSHLVLDTVS